MANPVPDLTTQQRHVFDGIKARKSRTQIAEDLGITPKGVTNTIAKLKRLGLVVRKGHLPPTSHHTKEYPWEVVEDAAAAMYRLALPHGARLRPTYPQDAERELSVAPVRVIRWGPWVAHGLLKPRDDERPPNDVLPDERVVVVTNRDTRGRQVFVASRRRRWSESDTWSQFSALCRFGMQLSQPEASALIRDLTLVIACVIGVESVMDLSAGDT